MQHDLYTVAYISKYSGDESDSNCSIVVRDILAASRRNNPVLGVTGALLLSRGTFYQVLEGPIDAVETCFEFIHRDSRHRDVKVLYSKQLEFRNFPQWSMASSGLSDDNGATSAIDGIVDPDGLGNLLVKMMIRLIDGDSSQRC
jgi:hypothetical protein